MATETAQVTPITGGQYLYSYSIAVSATSTVYASEFDLSFSGTLIESSIISPSNFTYLYSPSDPNSGALNSILSFFATDDGSGTSNIGISPGSSGTFSFRSTQGPAAGPYQVSGFNSTNGDFGMISGNNLMPSAVPEPASFVLCGLGLGFAGIVRRATRPRRV